MSVSALGRLGLALAALATGCQAPIGPPAASPSPAAGPAVAVPAEPAPAPSAEPGPAPVVTASGPLTRFTVPAGRTAGATVGPSRALRLVAINPADRPAAANWRLDAASPAPDRLEPSAPVGGLVAAGDRAARALAGARGPARRLLQAPARALGETEAFWINTGGFTADTDVRRTATLRRVSAHAYVYVDAGAGAVTDAQLDAFVAAFETAVYPKVTALFGEPARPGVDGDDRIFIVFSPAVSGFERQTDLLGYFWAPDAVPNPAPGAHSNQKEVLFLSDRLFGAARVQAYGILAHELEHLINFTRKGPRLGYAANEATWLDEGMAMLAAEAAGFGLADGERLIASSIAEYQSAPETYSLTDWAANPRPAFGQSYMFVRYMVDRYGPGVLKALVESDRRGIEAIDAVLAPRGDSFAGLFTAWAIANAWPDGPAPYRYDGLDPRGTYHGVTLPGFRARPLGDGAATWPLRPWGVAFGEAAASRPAAWGLRLGAGADAGVAGAAIALP